MRRLLLQLWERTFGPAIRGVESDANAFRNSPAGQAADTKTMLVLVTVAGALTLQQFADHPLDVQPIVGFVSGWFGPDSRSAALDFLRGCASTELGRLSWWACTGYVTYVLLPLLVIRFGFRERATDYGLKLHGWYHGWKIYLVFVAVMVPLVWVFSAEARFLMHYPFYKVYPDDELGWKLLLWEVLYALQFVALEFFFRGFIVHGTKHRFGVYSVFVMMVPYCMIHFRKPMPECVASIIAGIALGLMSLATRSIWLGAALHVSVAWGMDACSLGRKGLLW